MIVFTPFAVPSPASTATLPPFHSPFKVIKSDWKNRQGQLNGLCVPRRDIPRFITLPQRGKLPVQKLRPGTHQLAKINDGFVRRSGCSVP
jgi:alcohol dehydrogenase